MKNERERMDIISAYREVGSYRGAAAMCGTTHKTVKRVIAAHQASSRGEPPMPRVERGRALRRGHAAGRGEDQRHREADQREAAAAGRARCGL